MKKQYILALILALLVASLKAQNPVLTLDSCFALAKANNAQLLTDQLEIQKAQEVKAQVFTKHFPQVSISYLAYYAARPIIEYGINDIQDDDLGAFLSALITTLNDPEGANMGLPTEIKKKEKGHGVNATAMDLKDIDPNKENDYRKIKGKLTEKPELTQVRTYGGKAPYEQFNDTLKLSALPVGVYMVEVETLPSMKKVERSFYYVSNLRVLSQHLSKSKTRYVAVNATTGQPVGGAKLRFNSNGKIVTLTTDSKGEAVSETGSLRVTELFVTTDDDKACAEMNHYGYFTSSCKNCCSYCV